MKEKVSKKFRELYGEGAILFASPGRINLIGDISQKRQQRQSNYDNESADV